MVLFETHTWDIDAQLSMHDKVKWQIRCLKMYNPFVKTPDEGPQVGVCCAQPRALLTFSSHYCLCKTTKIMSNFRRSDLRITQFERRVGGHRQHEQDQPWRITRLGAIPAFHWLPTVPALLLLVEDKILLLLIGLTILNSEFLLAEHNLDEAVLRQTSQCLKIF